MNELHFKIKNIIGAYSVALMIGKPNIIPTVEGSSVSIKVNNRFFLITARHLVKHVLDRYGDGYRLYFANRSGEEDNFREFEIINTARHPNSDIGYIEVDYVDGYCNLDQCHVWNFPPITNVVFFGYPRISQRESINDEILKSREITMTSFITKVLDRNDDESYCDYRGPTLTVSYSNEELNSYMKWHGDYQINKDPRGFSGCGAWVLAQNQSDKISNPQKEVGLIGIQSCWLKDKKQLKIVPITEFVNMLAIQGII